MSNEYRHNHYVAEWYQKRFLPPDQVKQELFYRDLDPKPFPDARGTPRYPKNPKRQGFRYCFAERDLYTTQVNGIDSTEIERYFFGEIDREGHKAVEYYTNFAHPWDGTNVLNAMMIYMSTQKLRTPKGLAWLRHFVQKRDKNHLLGAMLQLQSLHCAAWVECVWQIADASQSQTKFILSDHPVTVYNRQCGPRSQRCRWSNDPDIWLHGTHTLFPLSLEKILILTNLSWVRNPYQSATGIRPNPVPMRAAMQKLTDTQTLRHLNEQEVREINFIIRSRAHRYIAAANEEWLYPENHVSKANWYDFGQGYLLMPDPRSTRFGGEMIIGYRDGSVASVDEYGRAPWDPEYTGHRKGTPNEWDTFQRFQGQFARIFGPRRRGRAWNAAMKLDDEIDDDEYHRFHLSLEHAWKHHRT